MKRLMLVSGLLFMGGLIGSTNPSVANSDWDGKGSGFGKLRDHYVAARKGRPQALLDKLKEYAQSGPILDVGTGTGISARGIADTIPQVDVIGIDHDETMLEAAIREEESLLASGLTRKPIQYIRAKVEALPNFEEKFRLVTAFSCFHWFDKDKALQEISKVLVAHGYFAVVGGFGTKSNVGEKAVAILEHVVGHKILHPDSNENYDVYFQRNGFVIVFKGIFKDQESQSIKLTVSRIKSTSYWLDVLKAGKEAEAEKQLEAYFEGLAQDGVITRERLSQLIVVQKL